MSDLVIQVSDLGKRYRIGLEEEKHDTLAGAMYSWIKSPIKNFTDLKKLSSFDEQDSDDIIWALREANFEVREGEVVGLIGRNGAGKTTLLKILSRITEPTTGYADIRGRVSSLLEVGTGFHPELTGRENIYLNATILGMTKREVDLKFDEIVDFSEVEKFIDTPVKRYSTGMRVRLAFAVAAHLDPDVLLVDEVLAVGDVAFQKKSLGKMEDTARSGRTVLFVSHNMAMIQGLCTRGILLDGGRVVADTNVDEAVNLYVEGAQDKSNTYTLTERTDRDGDGTFRFDEVEFLDAETYQPLGTILSGRSVLVRLKFSSHTDKVLNNVHMLIGFFTPSGHFMFACRNDVVEKPIQVAPGQGEAYFVIPKFPLNHGRFYFDLFARNGRGYRLDWVREAGHIDVQRGDFFGTGLHPEHEERQGVYVDFDFHTADHPLAVGFE